MQILVLAPPIRHLSPPIPRPIDSTPLLLRMEEDNPLAASTERTSAGHKQSKRRHTGAAPTAAHHLEHLLAHFAPKRSSLAASHFRAQSSSFSSAIPLLEAPKQRRRMNTCPSGILKKELDRQYSYENTVLGRYRLGSGDEEDGAEKKDVPVLLISSDHHQLAAAGEEDEAHGKTHQLSIQSTATKKSVRFRDLLDATALHNEEPREGDKQHQEGHHERTTTSSGARGLLPKGREMARKWAKGMRSAFTWKTLRLMLIDWLFLGILGIGMALTSMFMDNMIEYLQTFQLVLMSVSGETGNSFLDYVCTYLSWLGYTELLVICSAIFVHYVAPQAVGSGIPEMKVILRGVILKDYLTARTLISKVVGLTFSLGSGIPIGKMGPFVHLAANAANLLSNLAARFEGAYGNECRKSEMLAAACATGVACTFSAPIGGVLFSIEVTTMYFSVRNYWRGFFAAACGATVFRLLRVVAFGTEVTLVAFYQTHFPQDAFEPDELPFFALIGLFCGFIGAGFIFFYRNVVMFLRQNTFVKRQIQKNWLLYPILIAFLVATLTYPRGYGRFLSGRYKFTRTVLDFFSNCTWTKGLRHPVDSPHGCSSELLGTWTNHEGYGPYNVFLVLTLFTATFFVLSALCNTMPIPCGMFMPLFVVGAAFGRLMGEVISSIFPEGIPGGTDQPIFPGIYAVVGAAALTGAVTHSVSVAMICCEITGQLIYIIPLMIAVIIANAVCAYLQPSVYDVMIGIKHLPYLPDLPPSNAEVHLCTAEHIMVSKVRSLCRQTQFKEMRNLLVEMPKLRSFPVVDDSTSVMLLGSISRRTMLELLNAQIGDAARRREAERRIRSAIEAIDKHFREAQMDMMVENSGNTTGHSRAESGEEAAVEGKEEKREEEKKEESLRTRATSYGASDLDQLAEKGKEKKANIRKRSLSASTMRRCALSETAIAQRHKQQEEEAWVKKAKKKHSAGHQVFPTAAGDGGDGTEVVPPKKFSMGWRGRQRESSRFVVEPVQRRGPPPMMRNRRNAFSSVAMQGRISDDGDGESSDGGSTPPKKNSCPDLKGTQQSYLDSLEHQTSLSRNITEYVRNAKKRLRMMQLRHRDSEEKVEYDLYDEERREWEYAQLEQQIEIEEKLIDPAPFQLVRRTSVYKVHYLFSLLDLERAYVTDRGRLVGVVALRDLRIAIQNAQNGVSMRRESSTEESSINNENSTCALVPMDRSQGNSPDLPTDLDVECGMLRNRMGNGALVAPAQAVVFAEPDEMGHAMDPTTDWQKMRSPTCLLQMIQEDDGDDEQLHLRSAALSRRSSARSQFLSAAEGGHSMEASSQLQLGAGPTDVVQAVAYLRRKSIAIEDLKPLEETPIPSPEVEDNASTS